MGWNLAPPFEVYRLLTPSGQAKALDRLKQAGSAEDFERAGDYLILLSAGAIWDDEARSQVGGLQSAPPSSRQALIDRLAANHRQGFEPILTAQLDGDLHRQFKKESALVRASEKADRQI